MTGSFLEWSASWKCPDYRDFLVKINTFARRSESPVGAFQLFEIIQRLVHRPNRRAGDPPGGVQLTQQHQVIEIRRCLQRAALLCA